MNKLKQYLQQSTPINDIPWTTVILNTVLVILVLAIFEPFSYKLNSIKQLWALFGFAFVIFSTTIIAFILLPKICKNYYNPEKWTIGHNFIHYTCFLLFNGFCMFLYEYFIVSTHTPDEYFKSLFFLIFFIDMVASITIGLIPMTIVIFLNINKALKRNLEEAKNINKMLHERIKNKDENAITLEGSTKDQLTVKPESILYIESAANYVNVFYQEEGMIKSKMIRSTIKQIEEMLQSQSFFVRCHRAFIVNINQIVNVEGNAQGYKLTLAHSTEEIPVSRTYMKSLKDSLN